MILSCGLLGDTALDQRATLKDLLDALVVDLEQSRNPGLNLFDPGAGNDLSSKLETVGWCCHDLSPNSSCH
jgi:hypothetical protein